MLRTTDTLEANAVRPEPSAGDWAEAARLALQRVTDAAFDARHGCITVREYRVLEPGR